VSHKSSHPAHAEADGLSGAARAPTSSKNDEGPKTPRSSTSVSDPNPNPSTNPNANATPNYVAYSPPPSLQPLGAPHILSMGQYNAWPSANPQLYPSYGIQMQYGAPLIPSDAYSSYGIPSSTPPSTLHPNSNPHTLSPNSHSYYAPTPYVKTDGSTSPNPISLPQNPQYYAASSYLKPEGSRSPNSLNPNPTPHYYAASPYTTTEGQVPVAYQPASAPSSSTS
jgi:hypothetical protein